MARLSSEKSCLESSHNQLKLELSSLSQEHEKARRSSDHHKTQFDMEKKQRQMSVIKLTEVMQKAKTKDSELSKMEEENNQLYDLVSKLNAEKEILDENVEDLQNQLSIAQSSRPNPVSSDATVNALQEARRGHDEALSIVMREKEEAEDALRREREEAEVNRGKQEEVVKELERKVKATEAKFASKSTESEDLKKKVRLSEGSERGELPNSILYDNLTPSTRRVALRVAHRPALRFAHLSSRPPTSRFRSTSP